MSAAILTVNRVGFLGGVERVIVSCGVAAQDRGFRSILACPAPGELSQEAHRRGIKVIPLSVNRSKATASPLGWVRLLAALRQGQRQVTEVAGTHDIKLLHTHHPISALYAIQAARRLSLPLLLHVHETLPVHALYRAVMRYVLPYCAAISCVSARSREMIISLGAAPSRVRLIYNGVDPSFLGPACPVSELLGPGPHIGLFGVLEPRKGQDVFIEAARKIAVQYQEAQFWIVGELSFAENGRYVTRLRAAIAAAGLSDRIHLTGFRGNVRDWMASMNAIVLASRNRESLPTILIEGALLGRALVATDVGGVREIISDEITGLVVQPGDSGSLACGITRALGPDGNRFGTAARRDALQRFTFERFGDEIASLYQELLIELPTVA